LKETKHMSHKVILIAEDNVVNQKVAMRQLQQLGYRADAVANGREALEALGRIPYDLVLMDCQMPEMDGYEATAEIRRREGGSKHTAIVAMTAHALQGEREKCIAAGMDDYISKPVRPEDLTKVLDRIFADQLGVVASSAAKPVQPAPVDLERLHEAMGDEVFEIVDIYLMQMSENLKRLKTAVEAGDAQEVNLVAHNCGGTSANCGMRAVVEPLRALETMARAGSLIGADILCAQVVKEFERTKLFIEENTAQLAL